jgi:CBS domain-containing protein
MTPESVEEQLLHEQIKQLDLSAYCIVTADTSVRLTVERMKTMGQNCAFVVGAATQLIGILTDRDVLKKVVANKASWDEPVKSVMTPSPDTLPQGASTNQALRLMQEHHCRNVPVVDEKGVPVGNVTHYAILRYLCDHFPEAVYNLPPDPDNYAKRRDGG